MGPRAATSSRYTPGTVPAVLVLFFKAPSVSSGSSLHHESRWARTPSSCSIAARGSLRKSASSDLSSFHSHSGGSGLVMLGDSLRVPDFGWRMDLQSEAEANFGEPKHR